MIPPVRNLYRAATIAALVSMAACSAAPADTAGGSAGSKAGKGGPGGGGRGGITLSAADVATVQRAAMEEGTPVTGDLRPLETVDVRARIDGELDAVLVREGQPVSAGQVMARFDDAQQASSLRSAQAAVASAKVDLSTAQWNEDQTRELFKQGAVAEQALKAAVQATAASRARYAAAEAALRAASDTQQYTRVVAPISGIVGTRSAENGEHIARGATLFTVVRNDVLELTAAVPARQANGIMPGQTVRFRVDGQDNVGKVARVSPTIDPLSRSVTVYVQMPNPGGAIKGGTFATGRVVRRVLPNALVVPSAAIRQRPNTGAPFLYKIAGDQVAEADLTLGASDDAQEVAEVLDGVQEGDRIIVGNVGMLGKGMRVMVLGSEGRGGRGAPGARGRPGAGKGAARTMNPEQPAPAPNAPTGAASSGNVPGPAGAPSPGGKR